MRRWTVLGARTLLVLSLAAAVADLPLPAADRSRRRFHLIDRSASVLVPGAPGSLVPADADRIRRWDEQERGPGDEVPWASFGLDIAFGSEAVDASGTDLAGALEAVLARNPTEIVLHTDGRADPGRALLLCRVRGLPVHAVPLGPVAPRDARIRRVSATPAGIEATVESTFETELRVRLDAEVRDVRVGPSAPVVAAFPARPPGEFTVRLEIDDACPENNAARGAVLPPPSGRRVLVLSERPLDLPGSEVVLSPRFVAPDSFNAVVLDGVRLSPAEQARLADAVRALGCGLLLLGGPDRFALGGWKGTTLEELSPLRAEPDHQVAVVFAVDVSGSMREPGRFDEVVRALEGVRSFFVRGDVARVVAFSGDGVRVTDLDGARSIEPRGQTNIAGGLAKARQEAIQLSGRRHIVLLTDGEPSSEEKEEDRVREARAILGARIGLTVVTTTKELPELGAPSLPIRDWKVLSRSLNGILAEIREVSRTTPSTVEPREHPATEGVQPFQVPFLNLTSPKEGAQIAASVGRAPAVAFHQAGRGRVGAIAFEARVPRLLRQSVEHVARPGAGALSLTVEPPLVRARGAAGGAVEATWLVQPSRRTGRLVLEQVRSDVWEGSLPPLDPGTVSVEAGGAVAAATIAVSPELAALGVDRKSLERIASETGGRVIGSVEDLRSLPRPESADRRSGRAAFLAAALVLLFAELALSTFWRQR